ncbi:hypothetical protein D9611_009418 [Ephemerocybe angulata]|uniref:Opioid growth factor receptor (OGFr) conserved domain-containing protein n=1 Tax=Ephemerocybe angulata TaxID=980116 RepID=A0A8H5ETS0_9AGAR|nr:hypothetical protein D9611_009418 [Tulosesus angulatus]
MSIPRDVQEFLDYYPGLDDDTSRSDNLLFYQNKARCRPDRMLIEELHDEWLGDYETLEYRHGFIQWLFPIREHGMNYESQPLQGHEIEAMKADPEVIKRIVTSYKLMLDFYGMRLISEDSGLVGRSSPPRDFAKRYRNLVRSSHNYLRISRILKCLSEMGLEHLNSGFLLHVLSEQSENNELNNPGLRSSMDRWWANCIRNEVEREKIRDLVGKVRSGQGEYVFTRDEYEKIIEGPRGESEQQQVEEPVAPTTGE